MSSRIPSTYAAFGFVVAGLYAAFAPSPGARQPIDFNHAKHSSMACRLCHTGIESRAKAGLPPASVCAKCHARSPGNDAPERAAWERIESNGDVGWISLLRVPAHVYFSHRTHVQTARLACRNCHGDMERASRPPGRAPVTLSMDGCLGCHEKQQASSDCAACHR